MSNNANSKPDAVLLGIQPDGTPLAASASATSGPDIKPLWAGARTKSKAGETRVFYPSSASEPILAGSALGKVALSKSAKTEAERNVKLEKTRRAAALGVKALRDAGAKSISVDGMWSAHAAAAGAELGLYKYDLLKTDPALVESRENKPAISYLPASGDKDVDPVQGGLPLDWNTGLVYAQSQNLARELMEMPANLCTPTSFCERVKKEFEGIANVEVIVRDEAWAKEKGMRTFLSVAAGTDEPAKFLEIHYKGAPQKDAQPLAFVGKGITFDSGGISIKPGRGMKLMRGDMGGAATVVSATLAIAKLGLPINVITVTPLTENLPSGKATKPGDVIVAMNGKTIEVDNTDAEGRLVLSDAIWYASTTFKPHTLIDTATLTGACVIALGEIYTGLFTTDDSLWEELNEAGEAEADPMWRMPLSDEYSFQISGSNADLCNTGGSPAGSCTAALFLKSFVSGLEDVDKGEPATIRWAHADIAGVMDATKPGAYQNKGMTGRPVRPFVEFARRLAAKQGSA